MNAAAAEQMNSNNGGENILLQVRAHFFTSRGVGAEFPPAAH